MKNARRLLVYPLTSFLFVLASCATIVYIIESATGGGDASKTPLRSYFGIRSSGVWTPPIDTYYNDRAQSLSLADVKERSSIPVRLPSADAMGKAAASLIPNAPGAVNRSVSENALIWNHDDIATKPNNIIQKIWFTRNRDDSGTPRDAISIEYDQLEITQADMGPSYDGPTTYRAMPQEFPVTGDRVGTIGGSVAYISPPTIDEWGILHPGFVAFMKGTVQIRVMGYYPAAQLVAIANTL